MVLRYVVLERFFFKVRLIIHLYFCLNANEKCFIMWASVSSLRRNLAQWNDAIHWMISPITYQLRGSLVGRRWQIVADSITWRDGGPSRFFTASLTCFWNLLSSSICVVSKNWRPLQSWNLIPITSTTHTAKKRTVGQFPKNSRSGWQSVKETATFYLVTPEWVYSRSVFNWYLLVNKE